jgi:hypothetical protein
MDFENDSNVSPQHAPVGKAKNRTAWRVLYGLFFGLSVVANIVLLLVVVGLAAVFATGQGDVFAEAVLEEGPKTQKIAVISIEGLIDSEKAMDFASQLKRTRKDKHIKGLIMGQSPPATEFITRYKDIVSRPTCPLSHLCRLLPHRVVIILLSPVRVS